MTPDRESKSKNILQHSNSNHQHKAAIKTIQIGIIISKKLKKANFTDFLWNCGVSENRVDKSFAYTRKIEDCSFTLIYYEIINHLQLICQILLDFNVFSIRKKIFRNYTIFSYIRKL